MILRGCTVWRATMKRAVWYLPLAYSVLITWPVCALPGTSSTVPFIGCPTDVMGIEVDPAPTGAPLAIVVDSTAAQRLSSYHASDSFVTALHREGGVAGPMQGQTSEI
jgi:hypothetical protein